MKPLTLLFSSVVSLVSLTRWSCAADDTRLLQCVPAGTPIVLHIKNYESALKSWGSLPYAQLWTEPEVRAFVAPAMARLESPEVQAALARFGAIAEMSPFEFLHLLSGEHVVAVDFRGADDGIPQPYVFYGIGLGENRDRVESIVNRFFDAESVKGGIRIETNEFHGTTIHTLFPSADETAADGEIVSYAFVNDVVWCGRPRAAVEACITNLAAGGAESPITAPEGGMGAVLNRTASADAGYYFDLEKLVSLGLEFYKGIEATKADLAAAVEAGPGDADGDATPAKPSMLQQMGLTPDVIVHALGLDELRAAYLTVKMSDAAVETVGGLTWHEQRGLLRAIAYGDAPAPQPEYIPAGWSSVMATRFNASSLLEAIKESARTANPMLEFMITQNLAGLKQQTGVDVEADFFGALGDEVVIAQRFGDDAASGALQSERLWAISLKDEKAFSKVLQVAWSAAPRLARQLKDREYRGQMILSLTVPLPAGPEMKLMELAYVVTPTHLLVDVGGSRMLEEALDRMNGDGESFWTQPAVAAAAAHVADRSSGLQYQDTGQVIYALLRQLADTARRSRDLAAASSTADGEEPGPDGEKPKAPGMGLHLLIDPDAVPHRETIEKHFGTTFSAIFKDSDGVRIESRYENAP